MVIMVGLSGNNKYDNNDGAVIIIIDFADDCGIIMMSSHREGLPEVSA